MRRPIYYFFLLIVLLFSNTGLQAKHLVGGSLLFKYLGKQADGTYGYRINVEMYRDCSSNILPPVPFDDSIFIGLYDRGTDELVTVLTEYFGGEESVQPPNGGTFCTFKTSACLDKTVYSGTVYLPASKYGYYAEYQRCCRNQIVVNLVYGSNPQGQTYLGIIPPTSIACSSPYFNSVPSPYVCVDGTDTAILSNFALDSNGDSLVYKLAWPYGGLNSMMPSYGSTSQLPSIYSNPPLVTYNSGYSFSKPFGSGGYAHIDSLTGVTNLFIPNEGYYVIAYDVYAYRNGQLLTKVRRDLEIIAIKCPGKPAATRLPITGLKNSGYQSSFYIQAGDTVGFDIGYSCGDSIELTYTGDMFNGTDGVSPPYASLDSFTTFSQTKIYDHFFWQTACGQARVGPYVFLVDVTDNGCPPKSTYQGYSIYVFNLKVGGKIVGSDTACYDPLGQNYSVQYAVDSSHFIWQVTHGAIVGNPKSDSVTIIWDTAYSTGTIQVATTNNNGCPGDTLVKTVNIYAPLHPPAINGPQYICAGVKASYHVGNPPKGDSIVWAVKGDSLLSGITNASINVIWSKKTDTGEVYLIEYNAFGCMSDTEKYQVIVSSPKLDSIIGPPSVCPHSKNIQYSVAGQPKSTYFWSVVGGTIILGGHTNAINVDWGGKGTGMVKVLEITGAGCIGDTSYDTIAIEYKLQTPPIQGDTVICENSGSHIYSVVYSTGSTYDWSVTGGTIIFNPGNATIDVQWGSVGSGNVSVIQTAYDSVIGKQCVGQQIFLNVNIYPNPNTSAISGPTSFCTGSRIAYFVSGLAGSRYIWTINNDTLKNDTTDAIIDSFNKPGVYTISVVEISAHGCAGTPQNIIVIVSPAPVTSSISGPVNVCVPNVNNIIYSVTNTPGSTYAWQATGGVIVSGQGQNQITVNWVNPNSDTLSVTETNSFGCIGIPKTLRVFIDSLFLNIKVVTTELDNENLVKLTWNLKNNDSLHYGFKIYREKAGGNAWDLLDTVPDTVFTYIDKTAKTQSTSYYYKVTMQNSCGDVVTTPPHRTILLQGKYYNDSNNNIYWNGYQGWPDGVYSYKVYYSINQDTALTFIGYTNDTSLIKASPETGYMVCYRVEALDNADTTITSLSNKICFEMEPVLYVPNAFTPHAANGLNNKFYVSAINYTSFNLLIYNRWGEQIFTSNDPKIEWNGTFKGVKCPAGEYLYIVQVNGVGRNIYKSGTVLILE